MNEIKGLVISVGGAAAPITKALTEANPGFVLFVVSSASKPQVVNEIVPSLRKALQWEYLEVDDHQDIGKCYGKIRKGLSSWLDRRDLKEAEVAVDITGATKAMSAALALAAVERLSMFHYVGGDTRDKGNLGVVVDGAEHVFTCQNPWNTYAVRDLERAAALIREYHADLAADVLGRAAQRCDGKIARTLQVLEGLVRSFAFADRFDFKNAIHHYKQCQSNLELVVHDDSLFQLIEEAFRHWEQLREQTKDSGKTPGRETVLELLANADRRAKQSRYDDAVGRLYRATELHVQGLAKSAFGAELGKLRLDSLPPEYQSWMRNEFVHSEEEKYKLGVRNLYRVLEHCGKLPANQVGAYDRLKGHLQKRNNSLFAHGSIPVKEPDYERFKKAVFQEITAKEEEIPEWPDIAGILEQVW